VLLWVACFAPGDHHAARFDTCRFDAGSCRLLNGGGRMAYEPDGWTESGGVSTGVSMLGGLLPWGIFSALAAELVPWRPLPSLQPELGGFLMVLLGRTLKPRAYSPHTQVHTRSQPEERGRVLHNAGLGVTW